MTLKTISGYTAQGAPIKTPGWFSWRHRTREACDAAREAYLSRKGREAKRKAAEERNSRTPIERTRAYRREHQAT